MSYNENFKHQLNSLKEEIRLCKDDDFDRLVYKYNLFQLVNNTMENGMIEENKYIEVLNKDPNVLNKIYDKFLGWIDAPNMVDYDVLNDFLNEIETDFKQIEEEETQ